MSLHAESSCQLLGGKPLHAQYPVFFVLEPHSVPISSVINSVDFSFLLWYCCFLQDLVLIPYVIQDCYSQKCLQCFVDVSLCCFCLDLEVCHHLTICSSYFGFEDQYLICFVVIQAIYIVARMAIMHSSFTWKHWIGFMLTYVAYFLPYKQLASMAKPVYSDNGELLDGGFDLSTGGICE